MAIVLVLYPKVFNCYPKFSRKLERIISSLDNVSLIYPIDQMKVYVQNDPDLFRKAIKKLSRDYDLQIRFKNMKLEVGGSEEKQNGRSPNEVTSIIENLEF